MRLVAVRRIGALLLGLGLLGSLAVSPVLAAGIAVNALGNASADVGDCTLREAIIAANTNIASGAMAGECAAGSAIGSDAITFSLGGTITLDSDLPIIFTDMSIDGAGTITVSGNNAVRVFNITMGTVSLSRLTITQGLNPTGGGGIKNTGGTVSVSDSTLVDNHTSGPATGGGISNAATMTVTNTSISGGNAFDGGGIYNHTASFLAVLDSTISANVGIEGGGLFNGGNMTVSGSVISGNTSANLGGAIRNDGILSVTDSTISGNSSLSGAGGGIYSHGALTVVSSTISGNTAPNGGGGGIIMTSGGVSNITNATISGNTSQLLGGGIASVGTLTLTNSTISGNLSLQGGGGISGGGVETVVNSIIAGNSTGGNPSGADQADVLETVTTSIIGVPSGKTLADILVPAGLADNHGTTKTIALALVAGNPAIDTATGAVCAAAPVNAVDQRGRARPAACDIGAYEAQPPTVAAAGSNVSVPATSAAGAVVTYTLPPAIDEQGGVVALACLPASGSTFAVGTTTVTCTATDAVGHTGTGTFQVVVGGFVLPNTVVAERGGASIGLLALLGVVGLLGYLGLWRAAAERRRRR